LNSSSETDPFESLSADENIILRNSVGVSGAPYGLIEFI
jgi:hypothetical protein